MGLLNWLQIHMIQYLKSQDGQILSKYEISGHLWPPTLKNCFSAVTVSFSTRFCWKRCQNAQEITLYHLLSSTKESNTFFFYLACIQGDKNCTIFWPPHMYDGTLMIADYFGMHGWVIDKATSEAHPFTMNLFDVYSREEIGGLVNHYSFFFTLLNPNSHAPCFISRLPPRKGGVQKWGFTPWVSNRGPPAPQCTVHPWHATRVSLPGQWFRSHMRPASMT